MEHSTRDWAIVSRLVRETIAVYEGQPIDVVLVAISEALARVLAATDGNPDAYLRAFDTCTRRWLASGVLDPWRGSPLQ